MKVISIGDLVTDFYYKNGKLIGVSGGMSSHNIIFNIAKLGLNTAVYGVCGDDTLGKVAIDSLKDVGVNIDGVKIKKDIHTRSFHVLYQETNGKLEFISKKRCPFCNAKRWYLESEIEVNNILKQINEDDVLVFDNLNDKNQIIIDNCNSKKMLDLGHECIKYREQIEYRTKVIQVFQGTKYEFMLDRILKEFGSNRTTSNKVSHYLRHILS